MITRDLPMNHPPRPQAPGHRDLERFRANHLFKSSGPAGKGVLVLVDSGFLVNSVLNMLVRLKLRT